MAVPDGGLWVGYAQGGASFIKNGRAITLIVPGHVAFRTASAPHAD